MKKNRLILSLFFVALFIVSSAAVMPTTAQPFETDEGSYLTVGIVEKPDSNGFLNPFVSVYDIETDFYNLIYDPLIRYTDDWQFTGGLAESWEWATNGTQLTVNLVHNATWHDGTPFTSADVNWTLFFLTFLGDGAAGDNFYNYIQHIDHYNILAPDDYTVIINYVEEGDADIMWYDWNMAWTSPYDGTPVEVNQQAALENLANIPILPAHLWDPLTWHHPYYGVEGAWYEGSVWAYWMGPTWETWDELINVSYWDNFYWDSIAWNITNWDTRVPTIGTGPFKLEDYEPGSSTAFLLPHDYQWGKVAFDNMTIKFYESPAVMADAINSGELHYAELATWGYTPYFEGEFGTDVTVLENSYLGTKGLYINQAGTKSALLTLPEVKKAIAQALNRTKYAAEAYGGHANPAYSVIHSSSPYHNDAMTLIADEGIAAAKATLEAAGWILNATTGVYENGTNTLSLTLKYAENDPVEFELAKLVRNDLEAAGIDIVMQLWTPQWILWETMLNTYDLALMCWDQDPDPGQLMFELDWSWMNPTNLPSATTDFYYVEQIKANDTYRATLLDDWQQAIYDEGSIVVLAEFSDIEVYRNDIWEFDHTDWEGGLISAHNVEGWLSATIVPPLPPGIPVMTLVLVGVGVLAVVIVLAIVVRSRGT